MAPAPSPDTPDERSERIALLRELAAAEPGDATAHFLLGRELLAAGQVLDAAHAFEAAVRAQPDYSAAWRQLGGALEAAGRYGEAMRALDLGVGVAERTGDLQSGREMEALRKRLTRDHGIDPGERGID